LQSDKAKRLLQSSQIKPIHAVDSDTVILYHDGTLWKRSEAVLEIFKILGGIWRLMLPLQYLPLAWRDKLYNFVARNRYRWFGRRYQCTIVCKENPQ